MFYRGRDFCIGIAVALCAFAGACVDDRRSIGAAPPACASGAGPCVSSGGINGGADAGTDGGSGTSSSGSAAVTGSVVRYIDNGFVNVQNFGGLATIVAPKAGGGTVSADLNNGLFSLENVAAGTGLLFRVEDTTAEPDILTTLSYHDVKAGNTQLTLDAVHETVLSDLATCMLSALDAQSAHAVLRLVRGSIPIAGAFIKDNGNLGQIAYEDALGQTNCAYNINLLETSGNGFVLLLNLPAPQDGRVTLELTAPSPMGGTEDRTAIIDVAKNAVTYAWLDFQ